MTPESSDRSSGDLARSGTALKHDREWDYELDRIVNAAREREADAVGLQFPEGLKRRAPDVASALRDRLSETRIVLSGEPCYGACDLDLHLMRNADILVHFGHSPMKEQKNVLYVPLYSNVDPSPIVDRAIEELLDPPREDPDCGLVTTAQHLNHLEEIREQLEAAGYEVHTRKGDDRLTHEGQVLGCNYESANMDVEQILYVGGGKFHPLGLALDHPEKRVVIADPVNNALNVADTERFIKQRYGAIHRAMDAETWGVIVSTKVGQRRPEIATDIVESNPMAVEITMDEIDPGRLRNFGLDAYVNTACPRVATDDGAEFNVPVLTPPEYEIAVGNRDLEDLEFDSFHGTW
ncbi:diphthamide biosynthesis enzyme Dph2 [Halococcoides cellulosivorans]|uniref:2-(3-amino-3-carboxypropyl)histidine synthase n=1 Tax=Halococcoides cellulosivorans TaxID=1679096 RepID=A0A2R4X1F8_9EURY|nr:diphthamide biosynthesis enzyme Dph2 [Halococcoides cellulosivorans]AWB27630.1 diphthamide biosynthesis enzyme Dph2 [Halococcoides cellulosivorans]